jgi:glycosyltransferase involved in cell wall biosynthesis
MKKKIIFSAINVTSGGPLTILHRFIEFAAIHLATEYEVWFLIKDRSCLNRDYAGIHVMEFRNSQRTFLHKLYYEYIYFKKLSRSKKPYLWFSLNDCSPNVEAEVRSVYIHNATPLYQFSLLDFRFPSRVLIQKYYYSFFLRTNLRKNAFVVVQQQFMKDFVLRKLRFPEEKRVLVNRPVFSIDDTSVMPVGSEETRGSSAFLIYPTKPEVYKNVHRLTDAVIRLIEQESFFDFTLWLTLTGHENRYSRFIAKSCEQFPQIVFKGALSFPVLMGHVQASDVMVFPSKLETWGLPLSEAAYFGKWIVASDLPYARETLKHYSKVFYFDPDSTEDLMEKIRLAVERARNGASESVVTTPDPKDDGDLSLVALFRAILGQNN